MNRLVIRRVARAEFDRAAEWYDTESPGLGDEFITAVRDILDIITQQPDRYPILEDETRLAPVVRFPFGVYYFEELGVVTVVAVLHHARDPDLWRSRH